MLSQIIYFKRHVGAILACWNEPVKFWRKGASCMKNIDISTVKKIMAEVAAEEVMPRFRRLDQGDIHDKGKNDPVTVADRAAEAAISKRLGDLLPGSSFVGEEGCFSNPSNISLLSSAGDVWVIDPIDGTRNFIEGRTEFAVMVALVRNSQTVAAWIHDPNTGHTLEAERGSGVWLGENKMRLSGAEPESPCVGLIGSRVMYSILEKPDFAPVLSSLPALLIGSPVSYNYARMFAGDLFFANSDAPRASFSIYSGSKPWDHMPGLFMVSEAGGFAADMRGLPYDARREKSGLLVAQNADRWADLRKTMEPIVREIAFC